MKHQRYALLASAAMVWGLGASASLAQDAGADSASMIGEIVVTAQKREERLQDVPVAVSVAGGEQLERQNIANIDQLKLIVPSFEATSFGVSIRGVGTATFSTSIEPTVSTVIDGVVLGRPEMALGSFYDLDRVEVLRGPQGMLFGKNASSGVVSIVTRTPKLSTFGVDANFNLGEDGYNKSDATANLPLGDKAALRVGGYVNKLDGVLTNRLDGRRFNGNDEWGARAKLLWRPTDALDILLSADYAKQDQSITWSPYAAPPTDPAALALANCGVRPSPKNTQLCIDGPQFKDRENYGFSLQANWEFGEGFILSSITAGRRDFDNSSGDSDSLPINILNINLSDQDIRQFSQELRIASPLGRKIEYVAGLYYFKLTTDQTTVQTGTFGLFPMPILNRTIDNHVVTRSKAVFGQATFNATDRLRLIAGARYTDDEVSLDFDQYAGPGLVAVGAAVSLRDVAKADNISWRLGVQYDVTPVTMAYATVSRGYKGPGFNQTAVSSATQSQRVDPEHPTSYELGIKTLIPRGLVNLALFHTRFEDYQAQTVDFSVTPAAFRTINAGDLKTKGFEADITLAPVDGLMINLAGTYLDAKYGGFGFIDCYPGQPIAAGQCQVVSPGFPPLLPPVLGYDPSGDRLSGSAKWKATAFAKYQRPIGRGLEGFIQGDWSWRDSVNASSNGDPATRIDSYAILSGALGIEGAKGRWRAQVWGKNLGDKRFPASLFTTPFAGAGSYSQVLTGDAFRRFGVSLNVRY